MIISTNKTVVDYVTENIKTAPIFKKYGIDFCYRRGTTVEKACIENKIDQTTLEKELAEVESINDIIEDYNKWELDFLMIYIEKIHHTYVRENMHLISQYANKVAKAYGNYYAEIIEINQLFYKVAKDLLAHMQKEEQILFPFIKQLIQAKKEGLKKTIPPFRTINSPIQMMEHEHEHENVGNIFKKISKLSNNYTPPEGGCNTFRALYAKLDEFEQDLYKHIHLENNILHPKAILLEKEIL
ncbi:Iron-sulfur cluster repair di-iron protein [Tenacibaculum sediminilitoris]|uniref:DUF542 domain-containing protein n=1 Tax=Tenacibaculum sediminilitoris TaxID=1820334 RepID=UPI0038952C74